MANIRNGFVIRAGLCAVLGLHVEQSAGATIPAVPIPVATEKFTGDAVTPPTGDNESSSSAPEIHPSDDGVSVSGTPEIAPSNDDASASSTAVDLPTGDTQPVSGDPLIFPLAAEPGVEEPDTVVPPSAATPANGAPQSTNATRMDTTTPPDQHPADQQPVAASADFEDLFPFDARERSRLVVSGGFDESGGASAGAAVDTGFFSDTRLLANAGYSGAQNSKASAVMWGVGLASGQSDEFSFTVHYDGWQRNTPKDPARERVTPGVATKQIRTTSVTGVRTSLDWTGAHWAFGVGPEMRRIYLSNDIRAEERFSVGGRVTAGFFGWHGWDGGAWWTSNWYSSDVRTFTNAYRTQGGQLALELYSDERGAAVGYSRSRWRVGAALGSDVLALSGETQYWYSVDAKWRIDNAWTLSLSGGATQFPDLTTLWFISPRLEFLW